MLAVHVHRGPKASGSVTSGPASLGMRRLAIFEPANGHQPMVSPDGRHHLIVNGAIYSFRALRPDLAARGWVFQTGRVTEIQLAALAIEGAAPPSAWHVRLCPLGRPRPHPFARPRRTRLETTALSRRFRSRHALHVRIVRPAHSSENAVSPYRYRNGYEAR
jgi:hypothetical protein